MFFKFCLVDLAIYMGKDETLQLKTRMRAINPAVVGPFTTLTGMPVQSAHEAHGFTMFFFREVRYMSQFEVRNMSQFEHQP